MNQEWKEKIEREFPFMKRCAQGNSPYDERGIEFAKGWGPLLYDFCKGVMAIYTKANLPIDIEVLQVKEKFAVFVMYFRYQNNPFPSYAFEGLPKEDKARYIDQPMYRKDDFEVAHEEISALYRKVKEKSKETCELCGRPGILRDDRKHGLGYLQILCARCHDDRLRRFHQRHDALKAQLERWKRG